ncbi:MAG TPA: hypothetical protein VEK57_16780 [Thermoanaerobaculia bacterium]|nr:hypothetical protein [Thermoanaerobaculia bacterium]
MRMRDIRWGAALGGMLVAEVGQIAATFAWVAFYSYLVHPGETPAFYQRYAQEAGPWVSLLAGTPIFYLVCRWIGLRVPSRAWPTAMALFGLFVLVDLALMLAAGPLSPRILGFVAASYLLKLLACHLGGRSAARLGRAARSEVAEPA